MFRSTLRHLIPQSKNSSSKSHRKATRRLLAVGELETRITPDGTIIAASYYDGAIYKINAVTGQVRETMVGLPASTAGAGGLTKGPDGNFYISDQTSNKIFRYVVATDTLEVFLDTAVLEGVRTSLPVAQQPPVFFPLGLRFGPDGDLYVSMNGGQGVAPPNTGRIVRFDMNTVGSTITYGNTFVAIGNNLMQPVAMTFGPAGDETSLYVSSLGPIGPTTFVGQVSKITNATTATSSTAATTFIAPYTNQLEFSVGLAWESGGDLLVVDLGISSGVGRVMQFNPNGTFDKILASTGLNTQQYPADIVQDDQGHYFVSGLGNDNNGPAYAGSILRYNLDGTGFQPFVTSAAIPDVGSGTSGFSPAQMVFIPNQNSVVSFPSAAATYAENGDPVLVDAAAIIDDEDSPNFGAGLLTIQFTTGGNGTVDDRLVINSEGFGPGQIGVTPNNVWYGGVVIGSFSGGEGTVPIFVNLNGSATVEATQALLRNLTFSNVSNNPSTLTRTVEVTLKDGVYGNSNTATFTVNVTTSDDDPQVTSNNGLFVDEGATGTIGNVSLATTDPDNSPNQLTYTVTSDPEHGVLRKSGASFTTFTQADIDNNLITYVNDGEEFLSDSFEFSVSDGSAPSVSGTFNITINPQNDAPTLSVGVLTVDEGGSGVIDSNLLAASDTDNDADQLTYTLVSIPAYGTIKKDISSLGLGDTFTQEDVDLNRITYVNNGDELTSDSFQFTVADIIAPAVAGNLLITIDPVNDTPSVLTNIALTVDEGDVGVIDASLLAATDPDIGAGTLTFTVLTVPAHGSLQIAGNTVTNFTQADLTGGALSYVHDGGEDATDSFTFSVSDGSATSTSATFQINVTPFNDEPTLTRNLVLNVTKGSTTVIGNAELATTDPDNTSSQLSYTVSTPTNGTIQKNGVAVTAFSQADIDAGRISYVHDNSVATTDTFTFTVSDGGVPLGPVNFNIVVNTVPAITEDPDDAAAFAGTLVTLSAAATGSPSPAVQWQEKPFGALVFTDIPGATSTTYSFVLSSSQEGSEFRAVFTNLAGSTPTAPAVITVKSGLEILASPVSQTVPVGKHITFSAEAVGTTKTTVQWQVSTDGGVTYSNIPKATKPTLVVKKASAAQDGNLYRAVFTNAGGINIAASIAAKLTVKYTVSLVGKQAITVRPGTDVTLVALAKSSPATFQWEVSADKGKTWMPVVGATAATYLIDNPQLTDSGKQYRVKITIGTKITSSPAATLTVLAAPTAPAAPTPSTQTVTAGSTVTISTTAPSGTVKTTIQWQVSLDGGKTFTNITGQTKAVLTLKKVKATDPLIPSLYRVVFTNAVGQAFSTTAEVTVTV